MPECTPIKLLIVEDEENIRNLLKLSVDWEAVGINVVGEASTGLEALGLVEELLPDIVLTDIEMPYMDGLALSQRIYERHNDIVVIILTAHDHFEYAQQALLSNVFNYLLKPIDKEKLEQAFTEAVRQIETRRAKLAMTENTFVYVQKNRRFFRDHALEELVHKGPSSGLADILEITGAHFDHGSRYALAMMYVDGNDEEASSAQKYMILSNFRDYIEEVYAEKNGHLHVFVDRMKSLVLISNNVETDLSYICRQITLAIGENQSYQVYYGISDAYQDISQLPLAYIQANDAQRLAFISSKTNDSAGQGASALWDKRDLDELIPDLLLFIKSGLREKAVQLAVSLMRCAASLQEGDINASKMFALSILARAVNALADQGIPWLTLMTMVFPGYEQFCVRTSFSAVEELLSNQVASLSDLAEGHQRGKSNAVAYKVIRELEENYCDSELSLASVALKYSCNSSYLSRVFKTCTGKSFSEYLIDVRIQKAKEILERSDCKAYQLAQEVGIPDPGYFTKCFKKATGMSFQAYKASIYRRG